MLTDNELSALISADTIAVDLETKDPELREKGPGTHRGEGYICGMSVARDGLSAYIPWRHPDVTAECANRNILIAKDILKANNAKIGANIMYDLEWLAHENFKVNGVIEDVQYAEPLLNEYKRKYNLNAIARGYGLREKATSVLEDYNSMMGWKEKAIQNIWRMPSRIAGDYAKIDAELPLEIFKKQKTALESQNLWELYRMEMDLIPLLLKMRKQGVRLDMEQLNRTTIKVTDQHFKLKEKIYSWAGKEFNIGSSQQLAKIFDVKNIAYPRNAPTLKMAEKGLRGNANLDKMALSRIAKIEPICKTILDYRHYDTLINMFLYPYLKFAVDDRLYCSFHPLRTDEYGTVSGRFSASKPNLQQVPAMSEDSDDENIKGQIIRSLFIPEEGHLWAKLDYSQVEYRILAHYATGRGARELREKYNNDPTTDFHKHIQDSTGFARRTSKRLNFGGVYGMGVKTACNLFEWTQDEGNNFMTTYHTNAPYVKATRSAVSKTCSRRGYIFTILGRKARAHSSRKLHSMFNRLMQGGAADIMKKAMVDSWKAGVFEVLDPHITVHDELDVSFEDTKIEKEALEELKNIMENCVKLDVPVLVDCHTGKNWAEAD